MGAPLWLDSGGWTYVRKSRLTSNLGPVDDDDTMHQIFITI